MKVFNFIVISFAAAFNIPQTLIKRSAKSVIIFNFSKILKSWKRPVRIFLIERFSEIQIDF